MKNNYYFLALCFFISCYRPHPLDEQLTHSIQKLSDLNENRNTDTLVLRDALDTAFQIASKISNLQHDSLFAAVSRLYGNEFYSIDGLRARAIYRKGLSIGLRQLPPSDNIIFRLYYNTAQLYYIANDYKMALIYFDSVKINSQAIDAQNVKLNFLTMIADCYMRLNDPKSAERIYKDAEPLAQKLYPKEKLGSFYTQYSVCLRVLEKNQEAVQKAKLGQSFFQSLMNEKTFTDVDSTLWANNFDELAFSYQNLTDFQKSENYYLQALAIYGNQNDLLPFRYTLRNMGIMYFRTKRFDKTEQILTKGLKTFTQTDIDDNSTRIKASFFVNRSEVYLETKQYQKAIADHDSAIYLFTLYEQKPSLTAVMMQARPVLLSVLSDKAKAYIALAEKGLDTEGYQKALKLTQEIIDLADDIRADYFSDDAKLTLANDIKPALEKAIGLCQKLYQKTQDTAYLHKAFAFVEYSRSMVLYENTRLDNQLPLELKAENDDLKKREAALIAKNNIEDLQNYLRLKRQFREKIKSLNQNTLASVSTLQSHLLKDDKTAFMEYFVGDSVIYVFTLLQKSLTLNTIPKPKDLDKQIEVLRTSVTTRPFTSDATVFSKQSAQLSALLLRGQMPASVTKWIIAPDGVLSYLPFELLSPPAPSGGELVTPFGGLGVSDFRKVDFLIKHYQISYAYSANLLLEQKRIKRDKASQLFAGFASKYEDKDTAYVTVRDNETRAALSREKIYDLPHTREEVEAIKESIGGKVFINEAATERVFKHEASRYRILHFAMHSIMNNDDAAQNRLLFTLTPKDATEDNDFTAAELYTMRLNADLAVLSACNTGSGTLNKGEGVMSLARAFTYAGVPASVMSLWKTPDRTTAPIMVDFYKNLKLGKEKDAALREAKTSYLEKAVESIDANPVFWAGYVPMGNMEVIDMTDSTPLRKYGFFAILLALSGFALWFWRKKKQ